MDGGAAWIGQRLPLGHRGGFMEDKGRKEAAPRWRRSWRR